MTYSTINPKPSHKKRNIIIISIIIIPIVFLFPIPIEQPNQSQPIISDSNPETQIQSFDPSMENNELFISKNQDNGTHFRITVTEDATSEALLIP